ncbi:hypothetical protein LTR94_022616 [Friedmanniomyces endolithicus]|nr:hypothetical protein LTR94_022616 [Friedmanniomyces endolithicus]
MSANSILRDGAIRHALHSEKYSKGLATKIVKLLNSADADLVETIAKRMALIDERGFDLGPATTKRLNGLLTEIRSVNDAVYSKVAKGLKADLADLAEYEAEWAATGLSSATGISDLNLPTATYLRQLVERSPVDGHLLDSWTSTMSANRQGRVEQAIRLGLVQGQTTDQIVQRVRGTKAAQYTDGVLQISRNSAQTMVLTASSTVASNARGEVYKANSHIIKQVQWLSTLDSRTSPVCQSRDGQTWPVDSDHPKTPAHPRCRSVLIPVTKSFKELGIDRDEVTAEKRASMDGQVAGKSNFEDWIGRQSVARQDEVFGPQRAQLYRDGQVTFRDLFRSNGEYKSLDELRRVERDVASPSTPPVAPARFRRPTPIPTADIQVEKRAIVQKRMSEALADNAGDLRYDPRPEFRGIKTDDFGKAKFSAAFSDEAVSMIAAMTPELDAMADAFRIPRLRAFKTSAASSIASMGDGLMNINPTFFNAYAAEIGGRSSAALAEAAAKNIAEMGDRIAELGRKLNVLKEEYRTLPKDGSDPRVFAVIDEQKVLIKEYNALSKKHYKARQDQRKTAKRSVSTWKPGDNPQGRPFNSVDYYEDIADQARAVLYHEFAHHVHQMRSKAGPRRIHGDPPLERRLVVMKRSADMSRQLSKYSMENAYEWFAENFSAYMMGRTDLVDPAIIALIEELLDA